jgi:hypothetical protein
VIVYDPPFSFNHRPLGIYADIGQLGSITLVYSHFRFDLAFDNMIF